MVPNAFDLGRVARLVIGRPLWGDVFPYRESPKILAWDGRTAALRAFRDYICALRFFREGTQLHDRIPFKIKPELFYIDYPDNNDAVNFSEGTVTIAPTGRFAYSPVGLNSWLEESSANKYGEGTALQIQNDYVETFSLEFWCALKQQRRAFKAGVEQAMMPVEGVSCLRLRAEQYYDRVAKFILKDGSLFDDKNEAIGRRKVQLNIELRIEVVALVRTKPLVPFVQINTDVDVATGQLVTLSGPNAKVLPPGS